MSPKFLFVSEPTRGIDIGAKKLVLETLVRLNRELGMTVVIVPRNFRSLRVFLTGSPLFLRQTGGYLISSGARCRLWSGHVRHQASEHTEKGGTEE